MEKASKTDPEPPAIQTLETLIAEAIAEAARNKVLVGQEQWRPLQAHYRVKNMDGVEEIVPEYELTPEQRQEVMKSFSTSFIHYVVSIADLLRHQAVFDHATDS